MTVVPHHPLIFTLSTILALGGMGIGTLMAGKRRRREECRGTAADAATPPRSLFFPAAAPTARRDQGMVIAIGRRAAGPPLGTRTLMDINVTADAAAIAHAAFAAPYTSEVVPARDDTMTTPLAHATRVTVMSPAMTDAAFLSCARTLLGRARASGTPSDVARCAAMVAWAESRLGARDSATCREAGA